ncbi:DUF4258 domain-containing protein [Microcoleus sp. FACHB-1515]|uniref:DUF4258 domain-containing protein n=1 Tax=Microcoleus sp. FACHB-1515 TaxID=2692821 RepID=UPI00168337D9|nr:DUF4258 domain-containing protein [Microcoleus sp. FACHB-1515]MBD2089506.1 DUF4258 domain-containing protein [Microcoleus sp. FACHB-1515]
MTALVEEIRRKVAADEFEFSKHAVDQSILRQIRVQEVREAIAPGQVIEDYPEDKYGASCLICGVTGTERYRSASRAIAPLDPHLAKALWVAKRSPITSLILLVMIAAKSLLLLEKAI